MSLIRMSVIIVWMFEIVILVDFLITFAIVPIVFFASTSEIRGIVLVISSLHPNNTIPLFKNGDLIP